MADVVYLQFTIHEAAALYEGGEKVSDNDVDFHTASEIYQKQGKSMNYYLPVKITEIQLYDEIMDLCSNGWPQLLENIPLEYFIEQEIWWLQSA